jgi:hypothetical protein
MKALLSLKSALTQSSFLGILALVTLLPIVAPHIVLGAQQTTGQSAKVFEINIDGSNLASQVSNSNQNSLTIDQIQNADPLVVNLMSYLQSKGSPLAPNAVDIIKFPFWQRALGISLVESSMCIHTPKVKTTQGWIESYNCSGIGGNNYRIYTSYMDWFTDMNHLLGQPNYVNRPIEKFINYYVQPGSQSWLFGVKKTESDLVTLVIKSDTQRQQLAQVAIPTNTETALATFPENNQN